MNIRKISSLLLAVLLLCALFSTVATAQSTDTININISSAALDGKISTRATVSSEIKITSASPLDYIYIIYWDKPVDFTLSASNSNENFEGKYLHRLVALPESLKKNELTLNFHNTASISEIQAFSGNELPENVQNWEDNNSVADLLLFSTHADDEQLFFAGVLPLYATNANCETQVVYFTDHSNNLIRRHELLNGLWTVGVTRYPVISAFPDAYSESYEGALSNLERAGYTESDALGFQVEQIRRFQPLVILGHDLKGEYGHGQHILNSNLLTRAVEAAADSAQFPESAALYGAYNTPKLYLHLYGENQIVLDLDTPIKGIDKTPFQLSQLGYACHNTQQGYWFTEWINGKNGEITKASQIKNYSPCRFGLYRSTVGEDIEKTDLFENVTMRALIPKPEQQPEEPIFDTPNDTTPPKNNASIIIIVAVIVVILFVFGALILHLTKKQR